MSKPALVHSGRARKMALASRRRPRGTSKKTSIVVELPRYMFIIPSGKHTPPWPHRPADEVTRVTEKEVKAMAKALGEGIAAKHNDNEFILRREL